MTDTAGAAPPEDEPAAPVVAGPPPEPVTVLQQQSFHDTREIAAAETAGLPTTAGQPLSSADLELLHKVREAAQAIHDWASHIEHTLARVRQP